MKGNGSRLMLRRTEATAPKTASLSQQQQQQREISFRRSWSSGPCTPETFMPASSSAHCGTLTSCRSDRRVSYHRCSSVPCSLYNSSQMDTFTHFFVPPLNNNNCEVVRIMKYHRWRYISFNVKI